MIEVSRFHFADANLLNVRHGPSDEEEHFRQNPPFAEKNDFIDVRQHLTRSKFAVAKAAHVTSPSIKGCTKTQKQLAAIKRLQQDEEGKIHINP